MIITSQETHYDAIYIKLLGISSSFLSHCLYPSIIMEVNYNYYYTTSFSVSEHWQHAGRLYP